MPQSDIMQDLCANRAGIDTDLTSKEEECVLSELPENPPPLGVTEQELTWETPFSKTSRWPGTV